MNQFIAAFRLANVRNTSLFWYPAEKCYCVADNDLWHDYLVLIKDFRK